MYLAPLHRSRRADSNEPCFEWLQPFLRCLDMFKVARFWRITRTLGFFFAGTIHFLIKSFWIRATDSHGCQRKKIIFFQDVTATLGDGLAWIAPAEFS